MHSASRLTSVDSSFDPASGLLVALNELLRAVDGRVVLLRPLTACFESHCDDIDLLLTESQREQLLRAAFAHCTQGRIHCRIQQGSPAKAQLILWSLDCAQKLMIDLWTSFDQLPRRRHSCIPADRLLSTLTASVPDAQIHTNEKIPALRQLPPDIDLCLLIQHHAAKRRKITATAVRERIARACARLVSWTPQHTCQQISHDLLAALRAVADELPRSIMITPKFIAFSEDYLLLRLANVPSNRGLSVLEPRRRRAPMTELRKTVLRHRPALAVIGSDGAGKSSVVSALAMLNPEATSVVAKKFYRRSLTYQFISGLMMRLRGADRGMFDDRSAPLVTLRATAAMWINMCFPGRQGSRPRASVTVENCVEHCHKWIDGGPELEGASPKPRGYLRSAQSSPGHPTLQSTSDSRLVPDHELNKLPRTTILDRSIASFLITDRKSDLPILARGATWIEALIPAVTSVLLTLPHAELTRRKQEMSAPGHDTYQRMLFEQALRQQPSDLVLLANLPSVQAAATAICELLRDEGRSDESSTETAGNRKAVA